MWDMGADVESLSFSIADAKQQVQLYEDGGRGRITGTHAARVRERHSICGYTDRWLVGDTRTHDLFDA